MLNCTFSLAKICDILIKIIEDFIMFGFAWIVGFVLFVDSIFTDPIHPTKWWKVSCGIVLMILSSLGIGLGIE